MKPEEVVPGKFKKHTTVYNDDHFSVAFGIWNNEKEPRLAMRWNGGGDFIGYPSQGGHPLWFQLPNEGIWTTEILKAVNNIKESKKQLKDLDLKLK
jgi:hypothetical protein